MHPRTFKHIYEYRYIYSHKHIICYSSQIVLFDIRSFNSVRQAVPDRGTNIRNSFLFHVCFAKRIFKFRKVISCAYATIWGKFKIFIQIKASVIDMLCTDQPFYR